MQFTAARLFALFPVLFAFLSLLVPSPASAGELSITECIENGVWCCQLVGDPLSLPILNILSGLLGALLPTEEPQIGLACTAITDLVSSVACTGVPVCCANNPAMILPIGLVATGCQVVDLDTIF